MIIIIKLTDHWLIIKIFRLKLLAAYPGGTAAVHCYHVNGDGVFLVKKMTHDHILIPTRQEKWHKIVLIPLNYQTFPHSEGLISCIIVEQGRGVYCILPPTGLACLLQHCHKNIL